MRGTANERRDRRGEKAAQEGRDAKGRMGDEQRREGPGRWASQAGKSYMPAWGEASEMVGVEREETTDDLEAWRRQRLAPKRKREAQPFLSANVDDSTFVSRLLR